MSARDKKFKEARAMMFCLIEDGDVKYDDFGCLDEEHLIDLAMEWLGWDKKPAFMELLASMCANY